MDIQGLTSTSRLKECINLVGKSDRVQRKIEKVLKKQRRIENTEEYKLVKTNLENWSRLLSFFQARLHLALSNPLSKLILEAEIRGIVVRGYKGELLKKDRVSLKDLLREIEESADLLSISLRKLQTVFGLISSSHLKRTDDLISLYKSGVYFRSKYEELNSYRLKDKVGFLTEPTFKESDRQKIETVLECYIQQRLINECDCSLPSPSSLLDSVSAVWNTINSTKTMYDDIIRHKIKVELMLRDKSIETKAKHIENRIEKVIELLENKNKEDEISREEVEDYLEFCTHALNYVKEKSCFNYSLKCYRLYLFEDSHVYCLNYQNDLEAYRLCLKDYIRRLA
jgi:hypothetical protein